LFTLVGAGRFERPTPCAQGRFWARSQILYFSTLLFQTDGATLLQIVEARWTWRLSAATKSSTA